jgi:hypothetical protein
VELAAPKTRPLKTSFLGYLVVGLERLANTDFFASATSCHFARCRLVWTDFHLGFERRFWRRELPASFSCAQFLGSLLL